MISRSTWADAWRGAGHRQTSQWHFVDIEIDRPDLDQACFGHPVAYQPASAGPARDCVIDKVQHFERELSSPGTSPTERLLALKYVLHFIGDLHQPLHATDNHDRGGNCVLVSLGGSRTVNLHAFWDTVAVQALDGNAERLAASLDARIGEANASRWSAGSPSDWARETNTVGRKAYAPGFPAGCGGDRGAVALTSTYERWARDAVALQLARAGVRLALVLNSSLAHVTVPTAGPMRAVTKSPASAMRAPAVAGMRTAASIACSKTADTRGCMARHGRPSEDGASRK